MVQTLLLWRRAFQLQRLSLLSRGSFRPQCRRINSSSAPIDLDADLDPEISLLDTAPITRRHSSGGISMFETSPVFTGDALAALNLQARITGQKSVLPQRAVFGRLLEQNAIGFPENTISPKLYINTNAPFSAVVCGVQGSGKSHSTAVLLESCLIPDERLGTLPEPLSGLVFHFDATAGSGMVQPCEAAYLASLDVKRGGSATAPIVKVLVLPGNLSAMRKVYAGLPGVEVEALRFGPQDLSGDRLLAMMKVDEGDNVPLYMQSLMGILRSMEANFDYGEFRTKLNHAKFNSSQKAMLDLRLTLLDSCLEGGDQYNRVPNYFEKGVLTIIDLSSPFMDASSACGFFELILGLFVEADASGAGKIVVLDEAHKARLSGFYLTSSGPASRLTDMLLTVIRQQRHLATRVIISTQEPTVVPSKFLDLCSFVLAHRFSSPRWLNVLGQHVSLVGETGDMSHGKARQARDELFEKIVELRTGEAILFSPSGIGLRSPQDDDVEGSVGAFGQGYLRVRSRQRITRDGGHSVLAVKDEERMSRLGRVSLRSDGATSTLPGWTPPQDEHQDEPQTTPSAAPQVMLSEPPKPLVLNSTDPHALTDILIPPLIHYLRQHFPRVKIGTARSYLNEVQMTHASRAIDRAIELGLVVLDDSSPKASKHYIQLPNVLVPNNAELGEFSPSDSHHERPLEQSDSVEADGYLDRSAWRIALLSTLSSLTQTAPPSLSTPDDGDMSPVSLGTRPPIVVPGWAGPLVKHLRALRDDPTHPVSRANIKQVRTHFRTKQTGVYSNKLKTLNQIIERAHMHGLVEIGGLGKERWMELLPGVGDPLTPREVEYLRKKAERDEFDKSTIMSRSEAEAMLERAMGATPTAWKPEYDPLKLLERIMMSRPEASQAESAASSHQDEVRVMETVKEPADDGLGEVDVAEKEAQAGIMETAREDSEPVDYPLGEVFAAEKEAEAAGIMETAREDSDLVDGGLGGVGVAEMEAETGIMETAREGSEPVDCRSGEVVAAENEAEAGIMETAREDSDLVADRPGEVVVAEDEAGAGIDSTDVILDEVDLPGFAEKDATVKIDAALEETVAEAVSGKPEDGQKCVEERYEDGAEVGGEEETTRDK